MQNLHPTQVINAVSLQYHHHSSLSIFCTDLPNGGHGGPPSAVRPHPEDAGVRAVRADIVGGGAQAPLLRPRAPIPETGHLQMILGGLV